MSSLRSDLHDPASYANPTRDCDVIMKGGITSGVVYPLAACRVATEHRLRQLGGSSAGAIAAAIAAAAEHGRRVAPGRRDAGFPALATLPGFLGTNLLSLFQPQPETADAFHVVMAAVAPGGSTGSKVRAAVRAVQKTEPARFWAPVAVAAVVLALLAWAASSDGGRWGVLAAVLLAVLVLAVVAVAAWLWAALSLVRRTVRAMDAQGFGLVNGHDPSGHTEPLTDWMTRMINETAGLARDRRPLTLGDLWGREATEVYLELRHGDDVSPADWSRFDPEIALTTTTSCLNQGRPYQFPFTSDIFHYCPDCLRAYFPAPVMEQLKATSREASVVDDGQGPISMACPRHPHVTVRKLPAAPDLPVVMAARLSLSFPVLICAVPLHYVDFARARGKRSLVVGWFSDGGITTNFPMQFFDKLLPSRPTFGINLDNAHPDFPDSEVYRMPQSGERLARSTPITSVVGLLAGVKRTMQGWVDAMQMEVPGFRDRIVEVAMQAGEGGMNLAMPAEVIHTLSRRGDMAGQDLLEFDFQTHRWIRFRTAMASLSELLEHVHVKSDERAACAGGGGGDDERAESTEGVSYAESLPQPWVGSYRFESAEREKTVREELAQLQALGAQWRTAGYPAAGKGAPRPLPQLRHVLRR